MLSAPMRRRLISASALPRLVGVLAILPHHSVARAWGVDGVTPAKAFVRVKDRTRAEDEAADQKALANVVTRGNADLCPATAGSEGVRCLGKVVTDNGGSPARSADPTSGFGPADLHSAYKMPSRGGNGAIVAIVAAYHYPNAEDDLGVYRDTYGLPPCTRANGCFHQTDANGDPITFAVDPRGCAGWAGEVALDMQVASAMCPDCRILLVEVDGTGIDGGVSDDAGPMLDLAPFGLAVEAAVRMGAVAVSNSYGAPEDMDDPHFNQPGVLITAATGDRGFGKAIAPAVYSGVLAVGGTSLTPSSSSRGWAESAWQNGGSACSSKVPKPPWQTDPGCSMRVQADVSAVADPSTGLSVYCTSPNGVGAWQVGGGTSAAAPIVAAALTMLHVSPSPSYPWKNATKFFDITLGLNGISCSPSYLCNAGLGYDGPTGWGTPNGSALSATPPDESSPGSTSGCGCSTARRSAHGGVTLAIGVLLGLLRRRRQHRALAS